MWADDFVGLIFPRICSGCGNSLWRHEQVVCDSCLYHLPRTNFHLSFDNPVSRIFWGRADILHAASFLLFNKGSKVRHLVHALKYKDRKDIGIFLGEEYGRDLKNSLYFSDSNIIIPVPLHKKKYLKRGYNQSEQFAIGLSREMGIPCTCQYLFRKYSSETQTRKSRFMRWQNVNEIFEVRAPDNIAGSQILLVDDVVTTGATLESCVNALSVVPGVKICLATIAYARL
jgi:ComF family protein